MNVPNKISVFRLFMIPLIVLVWYFPYTQFGIQLPILYIGMVSLSVKNIIVLALFTIASVSDFLDGFLARMNNQITTFGKFVDPIADKCLTTTMFLIFAGSGIISAIPVMIMLWRDIIVDGIRLIAASKNFIMSAGILGKIKTVAQMICIILILLNNLPFALFSMPVADILLWFSTIISVAGGIAYYNQAKTFIWESK